MWGVLLLLLVLTVAIVALVYGLKGYKKSKCCKRRTRCCPASTGTIGPTGPAGFLGDFTLFAFNNVQQGAAAPNQIGDLDLILFPTLSAVTAGWVQTGGTTLGDSFSPEFSGRYLIQYDVPIVVGGGAGFSPPSVVLALLLNGVGVPGSGSSQDSDDLTNGSLSKQTILDLVAGDILQVQFSLGPGTTTPPTTAQTSVNNFTLGPSISAVRIL